MADKLKAMRSSDFKTYTLYMHPIHEPSARAATVARTLDSVETKNVAKLKMIPSFVVGIPTLLDKKNSEVYEGSLVFEKLETLRGFSYNTTTSKMSSFSIDAAGADGLPPSYHTIPSDYVHGESDAYKKNSKLSDSDLQSYITDREKSLPKIRRPVG